MNNHTLKASRPVKTGISGYARSSVRATARIFRNLFFIVGIAGCGYAQGEIINIEEAVEAYDILISKKGSGKGHVFVRSCMNCKMLKLKLTPETDIFVNGQPEKPGNFFKSHWMGGVVIYNVEEKQAVRLDL